MDDFNESHSLKSVSDAHFAKCMPIEFNWQKFMVTFDSFFVSCLLFWVIKRVNGWNCPTKRAVEWRRCIKWCIFKNKKLEILSKSNIEIGIEKWIVHLRQNKARFVEFSGVIYWFFLLFWLKSEWFRSCFGINWDKWYQRGDFKVSLTRSLTIKFNFYAWTVETLSNFKYFWPVLIIFFAFKWF